MRFRSKFFLVIIPIISLMFLFIPFKTVVINPKTEPELIFWASAYDIKENRLSNESLEICAKYDIGFDIVVRARFIDDYTDHLDWAYNIGRLKKYNVTYGIAIGGDDAFYINLDNADQFHDWFMTVRDWLIYHDLYDDCKWIDIDAELPNDVFDSISDSDAGGMAEQFINKIPTKERIEACQEGMEKFIKQVHDDGKEAIIVYNPLMLDDLDGDDDYTLMTRNIYRLDLEWDYGVCMIYRNIRYPHPIDPFLEFFQDYNYANKPVEYDENYTGYWDTKKYERWKLPLTEYYYRVSLEVTGTGIGGGAGPPKNGIVMFIGAFDKFAKGTDYINNKEFYKDIDICRHFGMKRLYFWHYLYWRYFYGEKELKKLGEYAKQHKTWELIMPSFALQREFLYMVLTPSVDRFLFLEINLR